MPMSYLQMIQPKTPKNYTHYVCITDTDTNGKMLMMTESACVIFFYSYYSFNFSACLTLEEENIYTRMITKYLWNLHKKLDILLLLGGNWTEEEGRLYYKPILFYFFAPYESITY